MITSLNNGSYNGSIIYSADTQSYKAKPTGAEIGGIRNRLGGEAAHRETSLQQLAQIIESGVTVQGAQLRSKQVSDENTDERFLRQQLFAVDLDNVYKDKKTGQKRKLPDAYETFSARLMRLAKTRRGYCSAQRLTRLYMYAMQSIPLNLCCQLIQQAL